MRYPYILQQDEKDCGPACLSTICTVYGLELPISTFRELVKTDNQGTSLYGILDGARKVGLEADALEGSLDELKDSLQKGEFCLPILAHVITPEGMEHYVVVHRIQKRKILVADPGKGLVTYSEKEFKQLWTGYIATFQPTKQFMKKKERKGLFSLFFALVSQQKKLIAGIFFCSLIASLIGFASAFIFQYIIDNIVLPTNISAQAAAVLMTNLMSRLGYVCLAIIGLYLVGMGLDILRGRMLAYFSNRLDVSIMLSYYQHVIDLPVRFFSTRKTGELMSRFSDASDIRDAVSSTACGVIMDSLMAIFGGAILCWLSPRLLLCALVMLALYVGIIFLYKNKIREVNQKTMENNAQVTSYLKESIDGVEMVKAFRQEETVKQKTENLLQKMLKSVFRLNVTYTNRSALVETITSVGGIVILWAGIGEVMQGRMTLGELMTFNALKDYFLDPIVRLIDLQPELQTASVAADRLNDIMTAQTEDIQTGTIPSTLKTNISLQHVNFRYGNRELVLRDVSFTIHPGERVALVGESGSGKTTLVKLLMAFFSPEKGSIQFGDMEIQNLQKEFLRSRISYLSQNIFFFADTVVNNLRMGNEHATLEEIQNVCKLCLADTFIQQMPMQYETMLDENANNLSGGQKQRLALARALLKKPDILILDEATSNLDVITEKSIQKTISAVDQDMTSIVIAHRLSTIVQCDRIFVMDRGQIVESGTHQELLARGGKYASFWAEQLGK